MGLIKTGLKVAVAVKTADVIHERIQRRQQEQWSAYGHPGAAAAPGAPMEPGVATAAPAQTVPAQTVPAQTVPAQPVPVQASPAAGSPDTANMLAQLKQLGELRDAGVLTGPEFEVQKVRILNG